MRLQYLQIQGLTKDFSTNLYTENSKHNFTIMKNFIKNLYLIFKKPLVLLIILYTNGYKKIPCT